jgi:hypothetical protein
MDGPSWEFSQLRSVGRAGGVRVQTPVGEIFGENSLKIGAIMPCLRRPCGDNAIRLYGRLPRSRTGQGIARRWLSGFAAIASVLAAALRDRYISADFPK